MSAEGRRGLAGQTGWAEGHPDALLPAYALGALDEPEQAAVEAHVQTCAVCAQEVAQLREAVDALAFAAPPVTPPPSSRAALLERVHRTSAAGATAPTPWFAAPPATIRPPTAPRRPLPWPVWGLGSPWPAWTAAAAGVIVAAASLWQAQRTATEMAALQRQNTTLAAQARRQVEVINTLNPATARLLPVQGAGAAPAATGRLVYDPRQSTALAVLDGLPPLEPGKTYQFWLLQSGPPTSAGTLTIDENGLATLVIRAPLDLGAYAGIGVTVEPAPGSPAPTGPLVAQGAF